MEKTELLGIGLGLIGAFFQASAYLCSRLFIKRHNDNIVALLGLSHIIMGIISVPLAIVLWPETMPNPSQFLLSLLGSVGFYLMGQLFLFAAIIHSEPSRVSPLLGLKIFMLSIIGVVFFHQSFGAAKWVAVLFGTISVFLLSWSGKRLELRFVVLAVFACLSYCVSDISIKALVDHFRFMPTTLQAASMAASLCYMLSGLVGVVIVLLRPGHSTRQTWLYALPFAASWFIGMIFLFSSFALLGVVFANIIQSTRGIISIGLGFVVAHVGFVALETKASKRMILLRVAAAILMTAAVVLFLI